MNMQKIGTIFIGIIFIGSTLAYAMSFAFSNPQNQGIEDPVKGDSDAKVTITEFSDFTCSHCRESQETIEKILNEYPNKVKLVFKNFPISSSSLKPAEASECAYLQGKFWEYHNLLFEKELPINTEDLKEIANEVGLDMENFNNCLDSNSMRNEVLNDREEGKNKGITGTPTFFVNGRKIEGNQPYKVFENAIESEL